MPTFFHSFVAVLTPVLFALAFWIGYVVMEHRYSLALAVFWAALATLPNLLLFGVSSTPVRAWVLINLLLSVLCALGILDNAALHNSHSGYGAIFLLPLAGLTLLSMMGCTAFILLRRGFG